MHTLPHFYPSSTDFHNASRNFDCAAVHVDGSKYLRCSYRHSFHGLDCRCTPQEGQYASCHFHQGKLEDTLTTLSHGVVLNRDRTSSSRHVTRNRSTLIDGRPNRPRRALDKSARPHPPRRDLARSAIQRPPRRDLDRSVKRSQRRKGSARSEKPDQRRRDLVKSAKRTQRRRDSASRMVSQQSWYLGTELLPLS